MNPRCLNCDCLLSASGPYCPKCGQDSRFQIGLRRHFFDFVEKEYGIDGRLSKTLKTLVFSPGLIAIDFVEGRRQRYISPVKLYFAASVAFFFCFRLIPGIDIEFSPFGLILETKLNNIWSISSSLGIERIDNFIAFIQAKSEADRRQILTNGVIAHSAQALLCFVPIFAGLLSIFFRRRRFEEHLTVAFYFHIFTFLVLLIGVIPWPLAVHSSVNNLINIVIAVYAFKMLRRFYQLPRLETAWRMGMIGILSVAILMVSLLFGLWIQI